MKIGILGGSFDPVHYGHLILADQLITEAGLDKVVFIPTYVSPFKIDSTKTSPENRLEMLRMAIEDNPKFSISDIEVLREGPSYTIDTLTEYSKGLAPDDELYLIMGQDTFREIEKWHRSDELLTNYRFIIGKRPGESTKEMFALFKELFAKYKNLKIEFFDIPEQDISSTVLRNKLKLGKSIRYFTPDSVIKYIYDNNLYGVLIPKLKAFVKSNVKESRYRHTEGVVETARKLAARYDEDLEKAEIAAWFHDAFRDVGNLEHGPVAADKITEMFGVTDPDIINAIRFHTTGHPGMSRLEKIIYVADCLEPGRDYNGIEFLRSIMYKDLDEVLYELMIRTRSYVHSIGGHFDSHSDEAIEELRKKLGK
ncbi:MAG: nicotinate-nucleotide adenylyltransferase [Firmicutes bacterium]|nr:nicotinate-nucleotide adenylyltransferase [Bacillota bacterium]